ncbi:RluA family pseudouridine synthase [Cellulophaga tyrosinoxydans]|uniref:23S rRNA pseudouridine1911/1915/1917 synthase n=1 Tax=Cellulophaga tyrosinoxydans TaxID=504486 RepID=A0A1W1ZYH1_9FLAO|nr:RluA family pseudouridine synthase [Cellulophaga tyrosinoxydans]SMC53191.1 23S rRNA pseudouridine1911/1915/1917 synthase [Cellulophaga tyrosinoxydans]
MDNKTLSTPTNLQIIYEDNHLIAINKRPGDIVQGDKTGDAPLSEVVKEYIKTKYKKPGNVYLGVTHRLDRPTSGVIVFAKTSKALPRLNKLFAEKDAKKTYWAVVKNQPPKTSDVLTHWLKRNTKQNKSYAHSKEVSESKKAILEYRLLKKLDNYFLLEIDLHTGRHHQIRAQLAAIGCTIKGDLKYGADRSNKDASIHLHARSLTFIHPVKKEKLTFMAPPPNEAIWNACL